MYKYLVMFVLASPLIGIWLVEGGEPSLSVGIPGTPNGATVAFSTFMAITLLVAFGTSSGYFSLRRRTVEVAKGLPGEVEPTKAFMHFSCRFLVLNCVFLFTMLFVFGGIQVWLGSIEKGLFRATLGPLGALPYLMTKFAVPALFAYLTVLMLKTDQAPHVKWMWRLNAFIVFLAGATWGFKTTGLFMLLPGLLIMYWKLPVHKLLVFAAVFLGSLVMFFFVFDSQLMEDVEVLAFLFSRLTILQGDVSWYVWGLHQAGEPLPNYWPTLLASVGDTVLSIFVTKTDLAEWMSYHYDWMLTNLSGSSLMAVANGHSVTGTPFAEAVIAGGGWFGVVFFGIIAGLLIGGFYRGIANAIRAGRAMAAAMLSTYFCFHVFSWLNGGGITQLFHISVGANLLVAYVLLRALSAPRRRRPARIIKLS
ncbi:hypothetical protein [Massilia cavernae]|uniref:Oligosaccharide repeat unit polymerase n=1 Tax=Massilia cavernae TaxID=2320864 RepID=A0A418Y6C5_9BURK|nr:hypothetical protein [Massilia cavernae]RJG23668.1 hypothetical protein D3872_04250 [Massilia cavernae]